MIVSIAVQASVLCPMCNAQNPLMGLRERVDCFNCARPIDVMTIHRATKQGGVRYHFGAHYDVLAEAVVLLDEGKPSSRNEQPDPQNPVLLFRLAPSCPACNVPLAVDPHPAHDLLVPCNGCGENVAVRAPDVETRAWDPRIACVVVDAKRRENPLPPLGMPASTIPCSRCAASLYPDLNRRKVQCRCGEVNFLGDTAWRKAHPKPEPAMFYLLYDVDDAMSLALHRSLASRDQAAVGPRYYLQGAPLERLEAGLRRLEGHALVVEAARPAPKPTNWLRIIGILTAILLVLGIAGAVVFALTQGPPAP